MAGLQQLVSDSDEILANPCTDCCSRWGVCASFKSLEKSRAKAKPASEAGDGGLTDYEQREIDAYERVGHILSLLKSKARLRLDSSRDTE